MSEADPIVTTVAVAPTPTTVVSVDVRSVGLLTLQVQNLDALQTVYGFIHTKVARAMGEATSTFPDFAAIPPAGTLDADGNPVDCVSADINCEGLAEISLVMFMSGLGGDVQYTMRKAGPKR